MEILIEILVALVKSVIIFFGLIMAAAYMTLAERKILAWMQERVGPNRVGPWGLLQPIADAVKAMFKEDFIPDGADKFVYWLAPGLAVVASMMTFAVIPVGPRIEIFGYPVDLQLADVSVGVLVILAISSLGVYAFVLAGWSSNSKYSMLGSVRSSAQMISYELGMGLAMLSVIVTVGSLRISDIVEFQANVPLAVIQPLAFLLFTICAVAENNRPPFDLPEAEQELVQGYMTEYSGLKFAMFYLAEYVSMVTLSSVAVTLFLGSYHGPFIDGPWWFIAKVAVLLFGLSWFRATLPRLRYDRLMRLGWQVVLPLALFNVVATAVVVTMAGV
ncbi:MAG: NADH-quinone oxidoreductase subunit NuoH [Chloroflexota bacterium]|jgi:NADH-quinone oxidoreductase subunit H